MLIKAEFRCAEVSTPIEYATLRPTESADPELPLLLLLHGGGQSREYLERVKGSLERAWADGVLPPLLAVTPSITQRALYMNARDGSERWEDALLGPFLEHVCTRHGASRKRKKTVVAGLALGGAGALRFAFKHPERFAAVAALEPSLEPVLEYADIELRDSFWHKEELLQQAYGSPIDHAYWRANHPTALAHDDPDELHASRLAIYLECGDEDSFGLQRGTELLHRVLFDHGISHEYRLVRGADHLGASMPGRFRDAMKFLGKVLEPPPTDPQLEGFHRYIASLKRHAGLADESDP
ncbi:MAG: esterase [Myxococcaceae bacterium]|nr:esterase [Myxococcaceae bacterium]